MYILIIETTVVGLVLLFLSYISPNLCKSKGPCQKRKGEEDMSEIIRLVSSKVRQIIISCSRVSREKEERGEREKYIIVGRFD